MAELRKRLQEELRLCNFSPETVRSYTATSPILPAISISHLTSWVQSTYAIYQLYLLNERKLAWPTIQVRLAGLRFFYTRTLKQSWFDTDVAKPKVRRKLPVVWSRVPTQRIRQTRRSG
jgi:hypothetical protein